MSKCCPPVNCDNVGGANFAPTLGHYSGIRPFRAWVQMVLPQVYNDALSYQELVYKLLWYINVLLEDVNTCEEDIGKLKSAFEQLQCYVNMYFYNLDMESIIDARLDAMAERGELASILMKYITNGSGISIEVTTETKTKEVSIPCYCKVCPLDKSCCPSCKWYDQETGEFATTDTIEYEVSEMNIHTDLAGGTGIVIDPESSTTSGTQTISMNVDSDGNSGVDVDVNDDGSVSYSLNLTDGAGIYTSKNGNSVQIDALVKSGSGTKVTVDTDNYYKVDLNLGEGSGVDVDTEDGTLKVSLDLTAEDGIEIGDNDSDTGKYIKALIKGGDGVIVELDDDNYYKISSLDSSSSLSDKLVEGTDIVFVTPGILYPVEGTSESAVRSYENYTSINEDVLEYPSFTGTVVKDSDGNVKSIAVNMGSKSYLAAGNMADTSLFRFRHNDTMTEVPCIILEFYFKGDYAPLSDTSYTAARSSMSPAVWNVKAPNGDTSIELTEDNVDSVSYFGGSWNVSMSLRVYTADDGLRHYCVVANSIGDGYNNQYSHYGDYCYGVWLNVTSASITLSL